MIGITMHYSVRGSRSIWMNSLRMMDVKRDSYTLLMMGRRRYGGCRAVQ